MGKKRGNNSAVNVLFMWMRKQSMKVKIFIGVVTALCGLIAMKVLVHDHNHFFVASEAVHAVGILVLIYKLTTQKTCSGISLKSQLVTALFLAVRLVCSVTLEGDIHTMLDLATLVATIWVIYMIQFRLKSTYIAELDNMPLYYLVVPCAVLAILINPYLHHHRVIERILWAFCVYLESISVLPQLRLMQNAKMIEPFTAHYVFALGVSRFIACAHWILQTYERGGDYMYLVTGGYWWIPMVLLTELVQTFILADFCYYYIQSLMEGHLVMKIPV